MREHERLAKAKVFTSTIIRVQMPDRTVLQGVFSPLVCVRGRVPPRSPCVSSPCASPDVQPLVVQPPGAPRGC